MKPIKPIKPIIVSLRRAARALGIKPDNLRLEAERGLVPCTKVGDEFLFELARLEEAIASRVQSSQESAHV